MPVTPGPPAYSGNPTPRQPLRPATTVVTGFQSGHGFTTNGSGVGSSDLNDTTDFVKGTQAVRLTTGGAGGQCNLQKNAVVLDTTDMSVVLYLKVDDLTHVSKVNLFIANESSFTNYYRWTMQNTAAVTDFLKAGEWQRIVLSFGDAAVTGAPVRDMAAATIRVQLIDTAGGTVTAHIGGLELVPEPSTFPNGVVSITADDCWDSIYTLGKPRMDLYGFPMTNYVIAEAVDTSENLTVVQLRQLQDLHGWEIAGHAYSEAAHNSTNGFADLSLPALDAELQRLRTWMTDNGFRGADHLSWPKGQSSAEMDEVAKNYFLTARTIHGGLSVTNETFPPANPMRLRAVSSISSLGVTAANVQTLIDQAFDNQSWLILVFHKITAGAASATTECSQADFNTIIDYINTKGIAVRTVGDVLNS